MKPKELKNALAKEIYYGTNFFFVLSDMEKENPHNYKIIENFVIKCKKERERIQKRKNRK